MITSIISKIHEIKNYHSSALHWNLHQLTHELPIIIDKAKNSYVEIEKSTKVRLHSFLGIDTFKEKLEKESKEFMNFSRKKAKDAQERERKTIQPKEYLTTKSKSIITISNYLGRLYFFTLDEIEVKKSITSLIETKHSKNSIFPSKNDIKDGLLKMILYCNLSQVSVNSKNVQSQAILRLTSPLLNGMITSNSTNKEQEVFFEKNIYTDQQKTFIKKLFLESKKNKFITYIQSTK